MEVHTGSKGYTCELVGTQDGLAAVLKKIPTPVRLVTFGAVRSAAGVICHMSRDKARTVTAAPDRVLLHHNNHLSSTAFPASLDPLLPYATPWQMLP